MLVTLSWDDVYDICIKLAEDIIDDDYNIDTIIGVSRGGLIPARIFADIFDIHDIFIITAQYYIDINKRLDKPIININTAIEKLKGKNVLIVDDITDTGNTMLALIDILKDKADNIKTLTLYKKPKSVFKPDYYSEVTDEWIVFPWERCETLRSVLKKGEDPYKLELDYNLVKRLLKIIEG
ncbi:MAG: phosphoribosyltransferase [Candidatus Nitrosocaldaceae archaeon]|nr:MAG: phosphoribosyltransferase [Candidatus Nitrosocaldaceae archaeon]